MLAEHRLGSSKHMQKAIPFAGILSNRQSLNPDFYNWNRIKVRYCDGASFTGDVQVVNRANGLYFRGARIFRAVIADLLGKGMRKAKNAVLSGCSAGGLTSILHCDNFRALLPIQANVKCVSDAGYFINLKDISGGHHIQQYFIDIVTTHGSAKNLPASCTSKLRPDLCFFPQYVAPQIRTPIFYVNAAYDSWQAVPCNLIVFIPKSSPLSHRSIATPDLSIISQSPPQLTLFDWISVATFGFASHNLFRSRA